ncbi:hybrid signal transduction histidine kinase M [Tanacetum coccineum]|uniref:Hybrid signal transduction histidine kinase M n=1 Tax=Tanacetum coccineum TaxID=301880 RepID=A0ABQ5F8E0_9ASTR
MTGGTPPPTPVLLLSDKLMTLTNITSIVPTKLDVDEMNYSSWLYFFKHLVKGYGLMDHLVGPKVVDGMDEASVSTPPQDPEWLKLDTIVLSWIFITCSKTLQDRLVDNDPQTAKEAWDLLESIFTDNKRSRAVTLKADLRALTLGDMSIDAYFRKIESTATLLARLGAPISNDDLVSYALAGLPEKYDGVSLLIAHREPFPDLKTVRSMLTTEEMRLKSRPHTTFVDGSSSSPLALVTKSGSSNLRRSTVNTSSGKINKPCFNFASGYCRFGEHCKYLHGNSNIKGNTSRSLWSANVTQPSPTSTLTSDQMLALIQQQQSILARLGYTAPMGNTSTNNTSDTNSSPMAFQTGPVTQPILGLTSPPGFTQQGPNVSQSTSFIQQLANSLVQQGAAQQQSSAPTVTSASSGSDATQLPSAFHAMTLQDLSPGN